MSHLAFEQFPVPDTNMYTGTLQDTLQKIYAGNDLYLSLARLVRATLDATGIDDRTKLALTQETTASMLRIYALGGVAVEEAMDSVGNRLMQALGNCAIHQKEDLGTIWSSDPELSEAGAEAITSATEKPILMLPLCHGGLIAGVQTFLYHQQTHQGGLLFPVRYSRIKSGDASPDITPQAQDYLRGVAAGRTVVVYDEDASMGVSVANAVRYFSEILQTKDIIGVVNNDVRDQANVAEQGQRWESCRA